MLRVLTWIFKKQETDSISTIVIMCKTSYFTGLFLYPLKTSEGLIRDQWHELGLSVQLLPVESSHLQLTIENSPLKQPLVDLLKPFQPSVAFHVETSHLICTENQMTGSFMKCKTCPKWVKDTLKAYFW